jgi:hypothetical protein
MRRAGSGVGATLLVAFLASVGIIAAGASQPALAQGVGRATWTPVTSSTTAAPSSFLVADDSILFQTDMVWDQSQVDGLTRYVRDGLRYTHEVNDRSGRLSATGYWATNLPDPAYDRDDDDGDGRWEEAEITSSSRLPQAGQAYTAVLQFSRWHGKPRKGSCEWAWDRRLGKVEVLSQLSRSLLGEWQAERYTLTYETLEYPRVGARPAQPDRVTPAHCQDPRPGPSQSGVVVTFAAPLSWSEFKALPSGGAGRWTAFEAIGRSERDDLVWTCGGRISPVLELRPCRAMGMDPDGVVAAVGYFDETAISELRSAATVARVAPLQDPVTGLLFDVGGFGVERPGFTVNDSYWELYVPGQ